MVEHLLCKQGVKGSNPLLSTTGFWKLFCIIGAMETPFSTDSLLSHVAKGGVGSGIKGHTTAQPERQSDPGRNQVSEDRYQSTREEMPQPKPEATPKPAPAKRNGLKAPKNNPSSKSPANRKQPEHGPHTTAGKTPEEIKEMTSNIARALKRGRDPEITRTSFPDILKAMAHLGGKSPLDITELRLMGTYLIGHNGKGFARNKMPQVESNERGEFLKWLGDKHGITFTKKEVNPEDLKPIQKEINGRKSGGILESYLKKGGYPDDQRILVTSDGHVLDGHHNWAAAIAMHILNPSMRLPVYEINTTWDNAVKLGLAWDKEKGVKLQEITSVPQDVKKSFFTDDLLRSLSNYPRR